MEKNKEDLSYDLYCLYHNEVVPQYYGNQIDQVTFVKMDDGPYVYSSKKHIYLHKAPYFKNIGKQWAEFEFYYSIYTGYKSGTIVLPEYLGFIQYDMSFFSEKKEFKKQSIIDLIQNLHKNNQLNSTTLIAFQPCKFEEVYAQHLCIEAGRLQVKKRPSSVNCIDTIINDCEDILSCTLNRDDLDKNNLYLCGSFFMHKSIFIKMMDFISIIIEDGRLDMYDVDTRTAGTLAERYVAVFISLISIQRIEFPLIHEFKTLHDQSKIKKLLRIIDKKIGNIGQVIKSVSPYVYNHLKR